MKIIKIAGIWAVLILLVLSTHVQLRAQSKGQRAGNAGAAELLIPVGSVGSALGGGNLALTTGTEAIHWNPAGAAVLNKSAEVMVSNLDYLAGTSLNYAAGVFKIGDAGGALGVSFRSLSFGDIDVTSVDAPDGTGETFSPDYLVVGLTYSRTMTDRINVGVTGKFISERIINESATGMAFDFGVQYATGMGVDFGIVLKNIGPNMTFDGNDLEVLTNEQSTRPDAEREHFRVPLANFELPTTLEIGLSYNTKLNESNNVTVMGSFLNNNFGFDEYKVAGEYNFNDLFFLRGGYALAYDADGDEFKSADEDFLFGPSLGAGLNLSLGSDISLAIDYAFRATELFDNNQWFTVRMGF